MSDVLMATKKYLVSEKPYSEIWETVGLYKSETPSCTGSDKYSYLMIIPNGCSKTWISDFDAEVFISESIMQEIIDEEN